MKIMLLSFCHSHYTYKDDIFKSSDDKEYLLNRTYFDLLIDFGISRLVENKFKEVNLKEFHYVIKKSAPASRLRARSPAPTSPAFRTRASAASASPGNARQLSTLLPKIVQEFCRLHLRSKSSAIQGCQIFLGATYQNG
jgi:hypothetical protein